MAVGQTASEFDQAAIVGLLWIVTLAAVPTVSFLALPTGEGGYAFGNVLFDAASEQGNAGPIPT